MKALLLLSLLSTSAFARDVMYSVPVSEVLQEFAKFPLKDFEKKVVNNTVVIEYTLPALLTGYEEKIHLEGKITAHSSELVLTGDKGAARCQAFYDVCQVEYYGLDFDVEDVEKEIDKIAKTPEEKAARLEVMRVFSTDPVGFIHY